MTIDIGREEFWLNKDVQSVYECFCLGFKLEHDILCNHIHIQLLHYTVIDLSMHKTQKCLMHGKKIVRVSDGRVSKFLITRLFKVSGPVRNGVDK